MTFPDARTYAAWSARRESSAVLSFAATADARAGWSRPIPTETADHGVLGCRRRAPALAGTGAYARIVYGLTTRLGLAISRTIGHICERHAPASPGVGTATSPAVAITGRALAVARIQQAFGDPSRGARVPRVGRLQ
jgi:hypothetical protein